MRDNEHKEHNVNKKILAMTFAFFSLPDDLCIHILMKWINRNAKHAANLDIALCNQRLRPQYLKWMRDFKMNLYNIESINSADNFVAWLLSRQCSVENLDFSVSSWRIAQFFAKMARRGVLRNLHHVMYDDRDGLVDEHDFSHLPSLKTFGELNMSVDRLLRAIQHLPNPEQLETINSKYLLEILSGGHSFINLSSIYLLIVRFPTQSMSSVLTTLSTCPHLGTLHIDVSVDSDSPHLDNPLEFPCLLSSLTSINMHIRKWTQTVSTSTWEALFASVVDFLLAVPNLSDLTVDIQGADYIAKPKFFKTLCEQVLCRLTKFTFDQYSHYFCGATMTVSITANEGDTLAVDWASWNALDAPDHTPILTFSETCWASNLHLLQFSRPKDFSCRIKHAMWNTTLISSLSKVTNISVVEEYRELVWAPSVFVAIFSLPNLQSLTFCNDYNERMLLVAALSAGLRLCIEQVVQCLSLRSLHLTIASDVQMPRCESAISRLPLVCPNLQSLSCVPPVSADALVSAVCGLSALQSVHVALSVVEEMTSEHWRTIAVHSKCRWWTFTCKTHEEEPAETVWRRAVNRLFENLEGAKVRVGRQRVFYTGPIQSYSRVRKQLWATKKYFGKF